MRRLARGRASSAVYTASGQMSPSRTSFRHAENTICRPSGDQSFSRLKFCLYRRAIARWSPEPSRRTTRTPSKFPAYAIRSPAGAHTGLCPTRTTRRGPRRPRSATAIPSRYSTAIERLSGDQEPLPPLATRSLNPLPSARMARAWLPPKRIVVPGAHEIQSIEPPTCGAGRAFPSPARVRMAPRTNRRRGRRVRTSPSSSAPSEKVCPDVDRRNHPHGLEVAELAYRPSTEGVPSKCRLRRPPRSSRPKTPANRLKTESLDRGIIPRTRGVTRSRDRRDERSDYNEITGERARGPAAPGR
jgi:hypothetical protein